MKKKLTGLRFTGILFCLILTPIFMYGQDLGSSSKLFRTTSKKTTKKKTTPKKKTTKRKKTTPKKSSSAKRKRASSTRRKKASSSKRKSTTRRTTAKSNKPKKSSTKEISKKPEKVEISKNNVKKETPLVKESKTPPNDNIVITVGQPSTGNFEELFEEAIIEGNLARNTRDYVKAENAYSRAKAIKPKDSRAIYGLGNLFSDQQRWEEAEMAYRKAIELEPNNPNAHIALSFVLTQPVVGTNIGERYAEAEKMAQKAIELNPKNPFAYDQLGVSKELQGILSNETESAYRTAIKLEPTFALAYAHLGRLLRGRGETKESSAAYRKAIDLSKDVPTMILVAEVLQSQQRYLESEQLLRKALRVDAKHPTALFFLGRALTTRGSFKEAEDVLMKSVEVSPNSFVSYTLLGSLYSRQKKWTKAEQILNKALAVVSENEKKRLAQEFESVGDGFMGIGRYKDAIRIYQRAITLDEEKDLLKDKLARAEKM